MSKNQKKRARKKQKKAVEADEGGPSSCADVTCAVSEGGGVKREEEKVVVKDPVEELKKKLSEAKASQVGERKTFVLYTHTLRQPPIYSVVITILHFTEKVYCTLSSIYDTTGSRDGSAVARGLMETEGQRPSSR